MRRRVRRPAAPRRLLRRQTGSAGLLTVLAGGLVACLGFVAIAAATDAGLAAAKARTAADAAALAAAGSSPLAGGDGDARTAAEAMAASNGAELVACCAPAEKPVAEASPYPVRAHVEVAVHPRLALLRAATPGLRSTATAVARPVVGRAATGEDRPRGNPPAGPGDHGTAEGALSPPVRAPISSGFGWRVHPISGAPRPHTGTDFAAAHGTLVGAAADGIVASAGWRGGYGKAVLVDHGRETTLYAHLSDTAVVGGQKVRRGDPLGRVGSTGQSTGAHLHFEVRVDGAPVDPASRLP